MEREFIVENHEVSAVAELTMEEVEFVSGGCGANCCKGKSCDCGSDSPYSPPITTNK